LAAVLANVLVADTTDTCEQLEEPVLVKTGKSGRLGFAEDCQLCVGHALY